MSRPRPRYSYLGSSDVAPILGLPAYGRTAIDVWSDKLRLSDPREPSAPMIWGIKLEPLILAAYAEKTGRTINRKSRQRFMPGYPHIGVTLDADAGDRVVEAKFSPYERDYGEPADGVMGLPLNIRAQVQMQMMVAGYDLADVPVLVRGFDLRIFEVEADRAMQDDLLHEMDDFWNEHVLTRIPPVLDDPEQMAGYLARRPDDGSTVVAPASLRPVFRQLAEARRDESEAEHRKTAAESILKTTMGEASVLTGQDVTITWRHTKPSPKVEWELVARAYRGLLMAEIRESTDDATERLNAIESLYTQMTSQRRFVPKFEGALAELATIRPQVKEVPDAVDA
jgi:predicted phage-related endonuclease